jgi:hypothetical protein
MILDNNVEGVPHLSQAFDFSLPKQASGGGSGGGGSGVQTEGYGITLTASATQADKDNSPYAGTSNGVVNLGISYAQLPVSTVASFYYLSLDGGSTWTFITGVPLSNQTYVNFDTGQQPVLFKFMITDGNFGSGPDTVDVFGSPQQTTIFNQIVIAVNNFA